ncbi:hypothetical protein Q1695_010682 [Nippostrongylus brasiliensis]|nr:hypothetical protein Q1695_010682 [Nippostrongylus brasiliensis]
MRLTDRLQHIVTKQEISSVIAVIISTLFGLINLMFAFYNLYLLVVKAIRPLRGMRMKINLGEKALMERKLPSDFMGRLLNSGTNNMPEQEPMSELPKRKNAPLEESKAKTDEKSYRKSYSIEN